MDLGSLKIGSYIVIDGEPCRIVSYDHSKPGKHGSAKARVAAMGVFDGSKHSLVSPYQPMLKSPLLIREAVRLFLFPDRRFKLWIWRHMRCLKHPP
jgi:translation initiation factor 5A